MPTKIKRLAQEQNVPPGDLIIDALNRTETMQEAADFLNVSRQTIFYNMLRYDIGIRYDYIKKKTLDNQS